MESRSSGIEHSRLFWAERHPRGRGQEACQETWASASTQSAQLALRQAQERAVHRASTSCRAGSPCSYPHLPKEAAVCLLLPAARGVLGLPVAVLCRADLHQLHGRHQDLLLLLALWPRDCGVRQE